MYVCTYVYVRANMHTYVCMCIGVCICYCIFHILSLLYVSVSLVLFVSSVFYLIVFLGYIVNEVSTSMYF